jgi:RNA polymerase sigma-70 factor (ECF subfamily)
VQPIFDASWQRDALGGQAQAIRRLAEAALKPLYRFCLYRVGGNHHLCEEVVQEALLGAIRRLDRYDPDRSGGDIFPWLTGLARNEIRRALGREKSAADLETFWRRMDRQLLSLYAMLETEPFGQDLLARSETRQMVNATMAQLPPHYGAALEAKYVLGHTVNQIATSLGTSSKAAESILSRARAAFRETFLALTRALPAGQGV